MCIITPGPENFIKVKVGYVLSQNIKVLTFFWEEKKDY
jgi:hypothetical protein